MKTATSHASENLSSPGHAAYRKDVKMDERAPRASTSSARAQEGAGNDWAPWNLLTDIARQQFALASEITSTLYRGRENLRRIQQETAHEASVRHGDAAAKLFGQSEPSDLLLIQSELLGGDLQSAGQYWQQLATAAMQTQGEVMASMTRMFDSEKDAGVKAVLEVFHAAVPAMPSSFFVTESGRQGEQQHHS